MAAEGFLASFQLQANVAGVGFITPMAPAPLGQVLFDVEFNPVGTGTHTFMESAITVVPEPAEYALFFGVALAVWCAARRVTNRVKVKDPA